MKTKVKEFIKASINNIIREFDNVSCAYEYDLVCDTHYIKILPTDFFYNSDQLAEKQVDIIEAFYDAYPDASIIFLTEGSLIKISNPEYVVDGKKFAVAQDLSWNHEQLDKLMNDFCPDIQSTVSFDQELQQVQQNSINCSFSFNKSSDKIINEPLTNNLKSSPTDSNMPIIEEITDDQTYFLAA